MKNVKIEYSKKEVNRAGKSLIDPHTEFDELTQAIDVINNWRSGHNYPINTFQATLRGKLKNIDEGAIVAQRLKRLPSIYFKLLRENNMQLSRMQDIGGLRAVVNSMDNVYELSNSYLNSRFMHELYKKNDYILVPKSSGYRSLHLVYKYRSKKRPEYDGIMIEIQIRTKIQHAWATAVETIGTFLSKSLKSSEGPNNWLNYLKQLSSVFAIIEKSPVCEDHISIPEKKLIRMVQEKTVKLNVEKILSAYKVAVDTISDDDNIFYYLLRLRMKERRLQIRRFSEDEFSEATDAYKLLESEVSREKLDDQVVLVSANSILQLKKSYPNYFVDTEEILKYINMIQNGGRIYI